MASRLSSCFAAMVVVVFSLLLGAASAQSSSPVRDIQALAVLSHAIDAAGGPNLSTVSDVAGTGTITYFWAGPNTSGTVTVKSRSTGQFRLDAALPNGTRSWAVSNGTGTLLNADGSKNPIPYHNAITLGGLAFPVPKLAAALTDTSWSVSYVGLVTVEKQNFYEVRVHQDLVPAIKDPDGSVNRLQDANLFFDPTTYQLVSIQNQTHPVSTCTVDIPHAVYFSDYRSINGVSVPFSITEYIGGMKVWSIQLSSVQLNTSLTDVDFSL
jgi:hypothetical protein